MAGNPWDNDPIASNPKAVKDAAVEARADEANIRARQDAAIKRAEFIAKYGMPPEDMPTRSSVPGDETKTGDDYLKTLEPALAAQVKAISEGRRPFPVGAALRSPQMQQLVAAATQYDPTLDAANSVTRVKTRTNFTSGKARQNITAINTALKHIQHLAHKAEALDNFGGIGTPLNKPLNAISETFGDKRVPEFLEARNAVASELTRVFRGTGGNVHDLEEWEKTIHAAQSPEQLRGVIGGAFELLNGRLHAISDEYTAGMGKSSDPYQFLTPANAKYYKQLEEGRVFSGDDPAHAAHTVGAFDQLPEGTHVAGEDVRSFRLPPEQEGQLSEALHDLAMTPEKWADMAGTFAKAQGVPVDDTWRAGMLEQAKVHLDNAKRDPNYNPPFSYSEADKAATENAGFGDTVLNTLKNTPESAVNLVGGLMAPATDLGASVLQGQREGLYKAVPDMVGDALGLSDTGTGKAFLNSMGERYGTLKGFKRAASTDPLGVAGDASLALTGGGSAAARLPGIAGRFGEGVADVGRAMNPLVALDQLSTKYGGKAANLARRSPVNLTEAAGSGVAGMVSIPSGVGGATVREAFKAGRGKGLAGAETPASEAFTSSMRDPGANGDVLVNTAREAVGNLRDEASQRYRAAMANFGTQPVPLDITQVTDAMQRIRPKNYDAMLDAPHRPADHLAWEQMRDTVDHYANQALQDPSLLEPLALDQFKQDLYTIGSKVGGAYDKDAARIAGTAYGSVKDLLVKHDPVYADTMKNYEKAAKEAQQLEQGFGLAAARGKVPNIDSATRRLQSIMRNNANTNFGQRVAQGERLAQLDPSGTLMPMLAGQTASSWLPRGLRANVGAAGIGTTLLHAPEALMAHAAPVAGAIGLVAPRVAGELSYGAGRAMGAAERLGKKYAVPVAAKGYQLAKDNPTAALALTRGSEYADQNDERLKRAMLEKYGIIDVGGE